MVVLCTGHPYVPPPTSIPLTLNSLQKGIDGPSPGLLSGGRNKRQEEAEAIEVVP